MDKFQHFKGNIYVYLFEVLDADTKEPLVIYEDAYGNKYARLKSDFFGYVTINGEKIRRFKPIDE